eukprot:TRINITY_DN1132_c4_g1_i1.p1 TRINITY_DN1132_c4_g1~~TRINITY_DN1132_c4_g1_i1.p1  ORF type:complete len:325 (+),score=30.10 TRINITY_DN1132_c4_g1_i1:77-976(+)
MIERILECLVLMLCVATGYILLPMFNFDDLLFLSAGVVIICAYRTLVPIFITGPLFDRIKTDYDETDRPVCRKKFAGHLNKFVLHLFLQVWGCMVLFDEGWFNSWFDLTGVWHEWDPHQEDAVTGTFRHYYLGQLAVFVSSILLQFVEPRSHDFVAMFAHHYGSATLIALSYLQNTHRFGILVLVGREVTDVMIHLARALGLAQSKRSSEAVLVLLTIAWGITRNWYHPVYLCHNAWHSPTYEYDANSWMAYNALLAFLIPLDYYYFGLAISAILRRIRNPHLKNIDPDTPGLTKQKAN